MVTTNDGGNNREVAEEEEEGKAEAEADTNSEIPKNSNGIGSSSANSESNYVAAKRLKRLDDNENRMIENNIGYDGENPRETKESQQQKCENAMPIANDRSKD